MFQIRLIAFLFLAAAAQGAALDLHQLPEVAGSRPAYVLAEELTWASHGLAAIRLDRKWGYVDEAGRVAIPQRGEFRFDLARPFSAAGVAVVGVEGKYGYIDRNGGWVMAAQFDEAGDFADASVAVVCREGRWGVIAPDGREVVPVKYESVGQLADGMFSVSDGTAWALADRTGKLLTPFHFECLSNHLGVGSQGRIPAQAKNGRWGFVDSATGEFAVPARYDEVGQFSEGFANFSLEGRIGYIDRAGRVLVEPRFDRADEFSEGLAAVEIEGQWGYLDTQGRLAIPATYLRANKFSGGRAWVEKSDGTTIAINRKGEEIAPPPAEPERETAPDLAGPVRKPLRCTVRFDHLNLGADLEWDGESRATQVRVFELDSQRTLAWDATIADGVVTNGIHLVDGKLVLLDPQHGLTFCGWHRELSAALSKRRASSPQTVVSGNDSARRQTIELLKAVKADLQQVQQLAQGVTFVVDHDATSEAEVTTNRIARARGYVDAAKALLWKIEHALASMPELSAENRRVLEQIANTESRLLQTLLGLK